MWNLDDEQEFRVDLIDIDAVVAHSNFSDGMLSLGERRKITYAIKSIRLIDVH